MAAATFATIRCRINTHKRICLQLLLIAVKKGSCGTSRTLELLLIMSQQELQKTSDLSDASAGLVSVSEVQMIHLLGGKVMD